MFSGNLLLLSGKEARSKSQEIEVANFQTSTLIIHITYCHMINRYLGLFYSFCCCFFVRFQSPFFCPRVLEILRISTTDQTNPLEFDQHRFCFFAKPATFFSRDFFLIIQMSQPGLEAGRFCSGRFFGRFFCLASWFSPMTFSAPALPMVWVCFTKTSQKNITKTGTINHHPKNQFRVCFLNVCENGGDVLCFFFTTVCAKA